MASSPETVYEGKFLRVVKEGKWEYVQRTKISGVVIILPLTADDKIILIEQFRPALGRRVVSLPAGLAGDKKGEGDDLLEAAQRELREETGYAANEWQYLTVGPSSSGLTDETMTFFWAKDAMSAGPPNPDGDEVIDVHAVPLAELSSFLQARETDGRLIDFKIFAALYMSGRAPAESE